jgi:EXPERA (EXPanded EBP superfamily)
MTAPLMPWFKCLVWSEVTVQLPFFFVAAYAFIFRKNWIRVPAIIYGSFVIGTMFPILGALAAHEAPGYNKIGVIGFYLPYLIIPALLVIVMAANVKPFATGKSNITAKKAKRG